MKRGLLLLFVLLCFGISEANLVLNGDFQDPDFTGADQWLVATGWVTPASGNQTNMDDKGTLAKLPGPVDNQAVRLKSGTNNGIIRQVDLSGHQWAATDIFTLTFNACEVAWQNGEGTQNGLFVTLKDKDDGWAVLWSIWIDLDGTHDGTVQGDWAANQTFSYEIDASTFTEGTEGGHLVLEFDSTDNFCWLDNVAMVPEPATLILLSLGSIAVLRKRK